MKDQDRIADLLLQDIKDEHAAIVQYVQHAYALGEGEMACEIEAIAREEMYHFKWLSEMVVALGGEPTIERGAVDLGGPDPADRIRRDVAAEERAIAQYKDHIAVIEEETVRELLERILSDEQAHREQFSGMVEELASESQGEAAESPDRKGVASDLEILNTGVRHEYTVILQYLYHSLVTPHCDISRELEFSAINEMQHLGWLAEKMADRGGHPDINHTDVDLSRDTSAMLQADIHAERAVAMDYGKQIKETEDPKIKRLLIRLQEHEIYHDKVFSRLLREAQKRDEAR